MPLYAYKCEKHGEKSVVKPMAESATKEYCPECGELMNKIWAVPNVSCDRQYENMDHGTYQLHLRNKKDIERNRDHIKTVDIPKGLPAELRPNV